jgi:hypothetical protein
MNEIGEALNKLLVELCWAICTPPIPSGSDKKDNNALTVSSAITTLVTFVAAKQVGVQLTFAAASYTTHMHITL